MPDYVTAFGSSAMRPLGGGTDASLFFAIPKKHMQEPWGYKLKSLTNFVYVV
jgi:hypothetical protein